MSLRVWLPLNGSVENKGISGVGLIQKTAPTYVNNGKIGKALSAGAFTLSATDTASILNNEEISFCFWIYPNAETGDTTNRAMIFGNGGMTAPNNRKFSIFQYPTCNDLHLSWQNDVTNTTFLSGIWNSVFPSYKWTHCAITYSKKQGKAIIYINGEQYSAANGVSNSPSFEFETYLMSNGGTFRYLNDYRIYDHCLSAKEVKEISQGLVLHYKLDNIYNSSPKIWSLSSYSRTADLTTSNTYIYSIPTKTVYLTPGKQYTVGAEVRVNQDNISFYFDSNCTDENGVYSGNDAAQTVQYNPSVTLQKNKWIPVWITTTIKADAGRPYYHHGFLFKTTSGTATTLCEIRNIQVYEGAEKLQARPFDVNNIITDSSGYGNNGIIVGTLSSSSSSSRYSNCIEHKDDCSSYIIRDHLDFLNKSGFSFSCWARCKNYTRTSSGTADAGNQFIMSQGRDYKPDNTTTYGASIVMQNGYPIWYIGSAPLNSNIQIPVNEWCHIVGTWDGTTKKIYVNGVLRNNTSESTVDWAWSGEKFVVGKMSYWYTGTTSYFPFVGDIADVRVYCTALSAEDILDLYHTSANIDNLQNIHAFELKDNEDTSQTLKNGIMATKEFHESNSELLNNFSSGGYAPAKDKANSCVNIGIADFSNYADLNKDLSIHIECDIEWTTFTAGTGGTFNGIWWQGSQYDKTDSTWKWAGTNYVCSALQSSFAINATRALTAGTHHYDVITTVPASWFNTYSKSNIGFRCDYSDGTGRIDVTNFKITPSQYYNAKIGKDFISANNFIEK